MVLAHKDGEHSYGRSWVFDFCQARVRRVHQIASGVAPWPNAFNQGRSILSGQPWMEGGVENTVEFMAFEGGYITASLPYLMTTMDTDLKDSDVYLDEDHIVFPHACNLPFLGVIRVANTVFFF